VAIEIASDSAALLASLESSEGSVVIGFFGPSSEASRKGRPGFEQFCAEHPELRAVEVNVERVKDLHRRFGVSSVPTVVLTERGKAVRRVPGALGAEVLARALLGAPPAVAEVGADARPPGHRVTVFTTPTCSWCTRTKAYLRQHAIDFNEVDVSRDEKAAQRMVARSGQMGVPKLDIDGRMVVGFDKASIDRLLGIGARASA
jgi:glutaredoxin-like YruB-family protein